MALNENPNRLWISLESCKNISKCIVCQNIADNKGDQKLTSTEKEKSIIVECSS